MHIPTCIYKPLHKVRVPQRPICLALDCFGCMVLGCDGRHGKSTFPLNSHEIAKCGFRTPPPLSFKTHSHCRVYFHFPGVCWSDKSKIQKLSHSVMFLCVIPGYITSLFRFQNDPLNKPCGFLNAESLISGYCRAVPCVA